MRGLLPRSPNTTISTRLRPCLSLMGRGMVSLTTVSRQVCIHCDRTCAGKMRLPSVNHIRQSTFEFEVWLQAELKQTRTEKACLFPSSQHNYQMPLHGAIAWATAHVLWLVALHTSCKAVVLCTPVRLMVASLRAAGVPHSMLSPPGGLEPRSGAL